MKMTMVITVLTCAISLFLIPAGVIAMIWEFPDAAKWLLTDVVIFSFSMFIYSLWSDEFKEEFEKSKKIKEEQ